MVWNVEERLYEIGVDRGVLYPPHKGGEGVRWQGLVSVSESNSGGELYPYFMDGVKYQERLKGEVYSSTIEAYTYPEEFAYYDGTLVNDALKHQSQTRRYFDFSYRSLIGDANGSDRGYRIHLVYNAMVMPTDRTFVSFGDSVEVNPFSWDISAVPVQIKGFRPTAHLIVDSTTTDPSTLRLIEDYIYGADWFPRILTPAELVRLFGIFRSGYGYGPYGHGLYGHGPGVSQ